MRTHIKGVLFRLKRIKGQYGLGIFYDIHERKGGFQVGSLMVLMGGR